MKKYLNLSLIYAFAAMICGVLYREITKWNGYTEVTTLGKVHAHLFVMGTIVFLIVALFAAYQKLENIKLFRAFLCVYNIGLPITTVMMVVRGITQILKISLSDAGNAAISGIAGIGHILTGVGIVLLLFSLKKADGNAKDIYKPRVPDLMEAIFDVCYLTFDLIAGILFFAFSKGNVLFILYGVLTLTLCGGDAFHLIPRVIRAIKGSNDKIKKQLGIGLQISSITMTVFYIILLYIWKYTFYEMEAPIMLEIIIWVSAVVRIVICFLPQNNWCSDEGNMKLSIIRNAVFAVTGIGVIILYAISGNTYGYYMTRMVAAIIISFGCYLPVTLLSKRMPKIGMLMIPKTCAYIWIIVMGLQLLF